MKQVVFAVILIAMASLTGCLNTDDDSSVDDDSTYSPSNASKVYLHGKYGQFTFEKEGNVIISWCMASKSAYNEYWNSSTTGAWGNQTHILFMDANSNIIRNLDVQIAIQEKGDIFGWESCTNQADQYSEHLRVNITLSQEPVRVALVNNQGESMIGTF